jgi:hypothetical protein
MKLDALLPKRWAAALLLLLAAGLLPACQFNDTRRTAEGEHVQVIRRDLGQGYHLTLEYGGVREMGRAVFPPMEMLVESQWANTLLLRHNDRRILVDSTYADVIDPLKLMEGRLRLRAADPPPDTLYYALPGDTVCLSYELRPDTARVLGGLPCRQLR